MAMVRHQFHRDVHRRLHLLHQVHLVGEHLADELRNLDAQIRDAHLTSVDVRPDEVGVVLVGVELRHRRRMDYYQREVGAALLASHQLEMRMDYLQLVALQVLVQLELQVWWLMELWLRSQ